MKNSSGFALMAGLFSALCLFDPPLGAQATFDLAHVRPADRVRGRVDEDMLVKVRASRHPLARPEHDAGRVAPDTRMERMQLVLQPDDTQQQALETLLEAQQDPQSPYYHQWLTPEDFGRTFGASENDLRALVGWLEGQGFVVESVPEGRRVLVFSGTASQVEAAFHTEIHAYRVNGALHRANAIDPEIPAALAPVVAGLVSLHDFDAKPLHARAAAEIGPDFTTGSAHYVAPADFATVYDLGPLYGSGTDGTGQSIAIAGRSNILLSDIAAFRDRLGLPVNNPTVIVNGPDPGVISGGEEGEATLDVEWAGAVARNGAVKFVVSASTNSSDGVALSSQYIVNHNLAPVMSLSFGDCEQAMGTAANQFWNALWQQAAAQGISVFVAAGDSGAAGCDSPSAATATGGPAVNGLCSPPYSTCVGGTQFNDTANPALYWQTTNNATTWASAVNYIPEAAWNESSTVAGGSGLWAGGGGASVIYTKPGWQMGTGVPAANHRYVPDVSLTSAGHDGYLVYLSGQFYAFAGTSAAAPAFAGLATLAVQRQGTRQGNVNPTLYTLASRQASGGAAVFHDTVTGNNSVKGVAGYNAGVGYDLATGLGSVDANLLVNSWANGANAVPSFQISAPSSGLAVTQGGAASLKVSVAVSGGFNAAVTLSTASLPPGLTVNLSPPTLPAPGSGQSTLTLSAGTQLAGTYNVVVSGSGGNVNQALALVVTVAAKCSYALSPASAQQPPGAASYTVAVTAAAGCGWTASSNASWIAVTGGARTGPGQVTYSLGANTGAARTGTLTIAGSTFTVTQMGVTCTYTLRPGPPASVGGGFSASIAVLTAAGCSWTAKSNASWISIKSGAPGTGNGAVTFLAANNPAVSSRTGTMTLHGDRHGGGADRSADRQATGGVRIDGRTGLGGLSANISNSSYEAGLSLLNRSLDSQQAFEESPILP